MPLDVLARGFKGASAATFELISGGAEPYPQALMDTSGVDEVREGRLITAAACGNSHISLLLTRLFGRLPARVQSTMGSSGDVSRVPRDFNWLKFSVVAAVFLVLEGLLIASPPEPRGEILVWYLAYLGIAAAGFLLLGLLCGTYWSLGVAVCPMIVVLLLDPGDRFAGFDSAEADSISAMAGWGMALVCVLLPAWALGTLITIRSRRNPGQFSDPS